MKAQMKAQVKTHKLRNTFFLFLTAMIWGAAFVAQSVSMDYIGPFTFICLRSVIGGLFLIPVIIVLDGIRKKSQNESADVVNSENILHIETEEKQRLSWKNKQLIEGGIVCGIFLFFANCFQQTGIQYTTVGKAGFITTFYIIIVPLIGLFFKKYCGILTWISVVIALAGLYFLCITQKLTIQRGDALILCCSVLYAGQILAIDHYNPFVDGVKMSCIQFLTGGILGAVFMLLFENPSIAMILSAAGPILYTGIMSTGVGYTLQIVGQKGLNPTVAALILSLESVFSALSGYVFLHQVLTTRELIGCVLMFIAIVLAQLPDIRRKV
ncbi:EamA domain [Anaerobutyricum hallii]|uniref:EamA domain n=1 Tax=Anaerobutyricum hallii TaxID=39488 RepID=A0A285PSJ6_9FIRM|nr:DMT family transporter [Anaerobutyricum hallii]MCI7272662.1 DMT family transporter [Anaerobutyricum hallii]SOB72544.1 EamA domain [Anaerobutyricum hallii]